MANPCWEDCGFGRAPTRRDPFCDFPKIIVTFITIDTSTPVTRSEGYCGPLCEVEGYSPLRALQCLAHAKAHEVYGSFEQKDIIMDTKTTVTSKCPESGIITRLAELPRDAILDETAMADIFDVVRRTIKRMELRYELPPSIRLGGKRCWKAGAVIDWIGASFEGKEKEAKRQLQRLRGAC